MPYFAGQRLTAQALDEILNFQSQSIVKASDQVYQSDTTFRNDTELSLPLDGDSLYSVEFVLAVAGGTAQDFKTSWSAPSGATGFKICLGPAPGSTDRDDTNMISRASNLATTVTYGPSSTTLLIGIREQGTIITTSAGTLTLQHAQSTSGAVDTGVKASSTVTWTKIR